MIAVSEDLGGAETQAQTRDPATDAPDPPKKRGGGPRTPEGRDQAKRNSLTHGMTAKKVFPLELEAHIRECTAELVQEFAPASPHEAWLVSRLGIARAKLDHCAMYRLIDAQRCVDRASPAYWDDDRRGYIEDLGARLSRDPRRISYALGQTKQGAEWTFEHWEGLGGVMRDVGGWDEAQRRLAFDLLGVPAELRAGSGTVPAGDDAPGLARLVAERVARLQDRLETSLIASDEADRAMAEVGMALEEDKRTRRLRRCEAECKREWRTTLAELMQSRAAKAPGGEAAATGPASPAPSPESPAPSPRPATSGEAFEHLIARSRQYNEACDEARADAAADAAVAAGPDPRPVADEASSVAPAPAAAAAPVVAPEPVAAPAPAVVPLPVAAAAPAPLASPARGLLARSASLVPQAPAPKNRRGRLAEKKQSRRAARREMR